MPPPAPAAPETAFAISMSPPVTMPQKPIPDFTETELWVVRATLKERYGKDVVLEFADTEVDSGGGGLAWRPTLFWSAKGAKFVVIKLDARRYRPIFYYHPEHQLGTGADSYDEIGDCVIAVLQVEADHMRKQKMKQDEAPAASERRDADPRDVTPLFWGD